MFGEGGLSEGMWKSWGTRSGQFFVVKEHTFSDERLDFLQIMILDL